MGCLSIKYGRTFQEFWQKENSPLNSSTPVTFPPSLPSPPPPVAPTPVDGSQATAAGSGGVGPVGCYTRPACRWRWSTRTAAAAGTRSLRCPQAPERGGGCMLYPRGPVGTLPTNDKTRTNGTIQLKFRMGLCSYSTKRMWSANKTRGDRLSVLDEGTGSRGVVCGPCETWGTVGWSWGANWVIGWR